MLLEAYRLTTALADPLIRVGLELRVRRGKEDRDRLPERLGQAALPRPDGSLLWVHGASVGESLAALPLIDFLLERQPSLEILLTTGTLTSARLAGERLPPRTRHQFVPVDRPAGWQRFFEHWRPDAGVLVESELWPNMFVAATRHEVPLILVNGRMSEISFRRWRWVRGLARRMLGSLAACLAQSEADADRLRLLGAGSVEVAGNLKRAAPPLAAEPAALADLRGEIGERPVWLAASTHPGEEDQVLDVHLRLLGRWPDLLLIVVPRHPERGEPVSRLAAARGLDTTRRAVGGGIRADVQVHVADTLGELGLFYRVAPVALIGGSLVPHGGQNPLEAARLGCVPILGPHVQNFAEIVAALVQADAAIRVSDAPNLEDLLMGLLAAPDRVARHARQARDAAESQREVLATTASAIEPFLGSRDRHAAA
jgi:3-deoxy-D-manno-octulosonic-acid transferase